MNENQKYGEMSPAGLTRLKAALLADLAHEQSERGDLLAGDPVFLAACEGKAALLALANHPKMDKQIKREAAEAYFLFTADGDATGVKPVAPPATPADGWHIPAPVLWQTPVVAYVDYGSAGGSRGSERDPLQPVIAPAGFLLLLEQKENGLTCTIAWNEKANRLWVQIALTGPDAAALVGQTIRLRICKALDATDPADTTGLLAIIEPHFEQADDTWETQIPLTEPLRLGDWIALLP